MAVGTYGTIRPADVALDDIDMYYTYIPNRETINDIVIRIDPEDVLSYTYLPVDEQVDAAENLLEGLYNMRLSGAVFNQNYPTYD